MAPGTVPTTPMSDDIRSKRSVVERGLLVSVRRAMTARYNRMVSNLLEIGQGQCEHGFLRGSGSQANPGPS